jgi:hypothetical protein
VARTTDVCKRRSATAAHEWGRQHVGWLAAEVPAASVGWVGNGGSRGRLRLEEANDDSRTVHGLTGEGSVIGWLTS